MGHSTLPDRRPPVGKLRRRRSPVAPRNRFVVFASNRHALQPLLDAINAASGGGPLIGVVTLAIGGDGFTVHTRAAEHASCELREAGPPRPPEGYPLSRPLPAGEMTLPLAAGPTWLRPPFVSSEV